MEKEYNFDINSVLEIGVGTGCFVKALIYSGVEKS
jgi:phospholipid N-methyltransferase